MDRITESQIALFHRYAGDIDGLARQASAQEKAQVSTEQWFEIMAFFQRADLLKRGLLSEAAQASLNAELALRLENAAAIAMLKALA